MAVLGNSRLGGGVDRGRSTQKSCFWADTHWPRDRPVLRLDDGLLPEAPRKERLRLSFDQCRAIARRQVEKLERTGIVEVKTPPIRWHSSPPAAVAPAEPTQARRIGRWSTCDHRALAAWTISLPTGERGFGQSRYGPCRLRCASNAFPGAQHRLVTRRLDPPRSQTAKRQATMTPISALRHQANSRPDETMRSVVAIRLC
jgi:hypothetical protein